MKRNTVLSLIGIGVLIVGAFVGVLLSGQTQLFQQKAAPATNLQMVSSVNTPQVGDTFNVAINIDSGPNLIVAAELYLTFDNTKLEMQDISVGSFLPGAEIQNKTIDNASGTATYIIILPTQATAQSGTGTLATLSMKALSVGTASLNFAPSTIVAAVGDDTGQNVLVGANGTSVTVQDVVVSPTPTVDITITPTTQATATLTPTTVATATVTPTNVPGATNTSTPTLTPTPTNQPVGGVSNTPTPTTTVTPTTNPNATATLTPTRQPTSAVTATGTTDTLPDAGFALPTILGIGAGFVILIGALFLAL